MKLYYSPGACSLSPHIALREAGLPFELVLASTKTHQLADGTDYYGINPKGYVPLLELDSGERLTEGPAIVQYIADQVPAKNLAPANGTLPRYRLQEWLTFIAGVDSNQQSAAIVRAVLSLSSALHLPVIAEGVETENERAFLMHEGCREIQGYLIGRPQPIASYANLTDGIPVRNLVAAMAG